MIEKQASSKFWDSKIVWIILAVISSAMLWVYVTMTEGDLIKETYPGVQVVFSGADTLRERDGLIITEPSVTAVTVTLEGTRSEISKLTSADITAVIDVSKVTSEGNNEIPPKITFSAGTSTSTLTNIVSSSSVISYTVVREVSKTISLEAQFNGSVAEGFVRKTIIFEPEAITISGPQNEISKVARALVVIDRQDIDRTFSFDSAYTLVDSDGNEVDLGNIRLSQDTVNVTVPISATKEVPLTVDIVEGAGATSENIKISCEPATITIEGDAEILNGYNKIIVGTIDLTSFTTLTYEETFKIALDNDVTNVTGVTEVKVTIQIIGLETRKFTVTNISTINVTAGYTSDILTESVEVTLRGPAGVLDEIKANNIRIVADVAELGTATGEFEPVAKVYVDGFTGVGAVGEYKVFVRIT